MAKIGFNVSEVAPSTGGGPLPAGTYTFHAIEEELGANSKGTGELLKLTYEVVAADDEKLVGRKVWVQMNISHENPVAQKIGQEEFSALCHAIGEMVDDSADLLWKEFRATTKVTVDKQSGKERAEIKKYLFGDEQAPPAEKAAPTRPTAPARSGAAASAPASGRKLPWKREA